MKKIYTLASVISIAICSFAQSTGFMSPTNTATPNGFTNANLAYVSDDQWSTVVHQSGCRCPFLYLSWNGGTNYTSSDILGPFGTTDAIQTAGNPTNTWGHAWTLSEFSNANFRLKIANPSTLIQQGYADFNFIIPNGATITGVEVRLEWHGDAGFTMEFLDHAQVNVHYLASTSTIDITNTDELLHVYPNPATEAVTLSTNGIGLLGYSLFSADGKLVAQSSEQVSANADVQLSLIGISKGIYFLQVITDKGVLMRKIVVQ